jgi:hypothetical protein
LRRPAYLAAWVYLCAWILALSLNSLPGSVRFGSMGIAAAAIVVIGLVLIEPRPTRAPAVPSDNRADWPSGSACQ